MNPRNYLVTAAALLALASPAVHPAGAAIPADEWARTMHVSTATSHQVQSGSVKTTHRKHGKSTATAIRVGAYSAHAYVHGGASQKVAKAITKAGKKKAVTKPAVPRPVILLPASTSQSSITDACLLDNICTTLQNCELWGLDCELVQPAAPVAEGSAAAEPSAPVETPPTVDLAAVPPATGPADAASTTYDLYQDC